MEGTLALWPDPVNEFVHNAHESANAGAIFGQYLLEPVHKLVILCRRVLTLGACRY